MERRPTQPESPPEAPRSSRSLAERRMRLEQALANMRIEGHQPSPEFLADMTALISDQVSDDKVRERIVARAQAADRLACGED